MLPRIAREVRAWDSRALAAADPPLREDAIDALTRKRAQTEGAALFVTLAQRLSNAYVRVLVAYQIIWDYLDSAHERSAGVVNGVQLHCALEDALDPGELPRRHYQKHPWQDDGGYLHALIAQCRLCVSRLPSYTRVRPILQLHAAESRRVLSTNHDSDSARREASLKALVEPAPAGECRMTWFERSAAASAGLPIFALLARGVERRPPTDIEAIRDTYAALVSALATMLDSYVDRVEDDANGDHCYIAYYPTLEIAVERTGWMIREALAGVRALRDPHRHVVIVASMVAMYLTRDSSRTAEFERCTRRLTRSGGTLTRALIPVVRAWRVLCALRFS